MTSANVFNLNSVKQGQVLNANAAKGRTKEQNQKAAAVFASLMNGNYSTGKPVVNADDINSSVNVKNVQKSGAEGSYRFERRDNSIEPAVQTSVADKIKDSAKELTQFQKDVVQTVADELGVSEEAVEEAAASLGLTVFDLLNPENLAQLAMQLTEETSPMNLLVNAQFQNLMQNMQEIGSDLASQLGFTSDQMDELVAQMDILEAPLQVTGQESEANTSGETETESMIQTMGTEPVGKNNAEVYVETDTGINMGDGEEAQVSTADTNVSETLTNGKVSEADVQKEQEPQADEIRTQQPVKQETDGQSKESGQNTGSQSEETLLQPSDSEHGHSQIHPENHTSTVFQLNEAVAQSQPEVNQPVSQTYLSIDTMDLIEQVAEQVRVHISEGTTSMEMQLNPENLGKVYVNVYSREGTIHAQLAASNESVRAALETQVADLRQNLTQAGVKVDAIEVTVAAHEFERNLEQNGESEKQQGELQEEKVSHRRNLNSDSLDELSGLMTEEETLAAQIMRDNGNSVDLTA